jgi:cell division protein FtsL
VVRRRRPKIFFALVTVFTIVIIIVAQILLSVSLQSGAYEIAGLQRSVKELGRTYQSATQDLNRMTSPQNVAQSAEMLGMVGHSNPVYLRLSDSLITGAATSAMGRRTARQRHFRPSPRYLRLRDCRAPQPASPQDYRENKNQPPPCSDVVRCGRDHCRIFCHAFD